MPRRTGIDTVFDNLDMPTADELATAAKVESALAMPLDDEDVNQLEEGLPGDMEGSNNPEEMSDEDYQAAVSAGIEAAENYIDMELSPDRELAAKYYRAEPFGNEETGRSGVVMSEVRDTVLGLMPAMLRVFCGNTDAVEFINTEGTPSDQAMHQTAYINHIIHKDNDGFTMFYSAFKDAFVRKTGVFTWWFEEREEVTSEIHTGLDEDAYALLQIEKSESSSEDDNIVYDIRVVDERPDTTAPEESPDILGMGAEPDMLGAPTPAPPQAFIRDVRVFRRAIVKRHRTEAVPPEEFILTPLASADIDIFPLVGRRQMKTIGELVAIGHDEDEIREAIGGTGSNLSSLEMNSERTDRDGATMERIFDPGFSGSDPASEYVKYVTAYVLIDRDGDGILERRKICTVGDNNKVIYDEVVSGMVPFAIICPDPEPHSPFGYSIADQTMDMQEIKSEMIRGVLDSLAESIFGRTAIVEGKVNIDDALSSARDQLIRIKEPGAIQTLSNAFNGMNAMPVMEYLDNMKARRTGVTMSPSGLDPQALQSTSTEAVTATVDASQERAEMIARIFAETGIKRLFRGLLQQVVRHQDKKRTIRLRGKPIVVDPRTFVADLDLDTNVGLGRGNSAKRISALSMILMQQKEVYTAYGPSNPIVTLHHISNTVEDMARESGFNDVSRYMAPISAEQAAQIAQQAAAQAEKPSPEELLYRAQSEKTAAELERTRMQEITKLRIAGLRDDFQRDDMEATFYVKAAEMLGKFGVQVDEMQMRAMMQANDDAQALADNAQARADTAMAPPQAPNGATSDV